MIEYANCRLELRGQDGPRQGRHYDVIAMLITAPARKNEYTSSSHKLVNFLGGRVDDLAIAEVMKMEPAARPANFMANVPDALGFAYSLRRLSDNVQTPQGWRYGDEELPQRYVTWNRAGSGMGGKTDRWDRWSCTAQGLNHVFDLTRRDD